MIKPTVARMVHFWQHEPLTRADQPEAAIVTYVWGDDLVNLSVFGANGYQRSEQRVPLYQGEPHVKPRSRYCEWMPYQKGQAAKTEELHGELREAHSEELRKALRNQAELERELDREEGKDGE